MLHHRHALQGKCSRVISYTEKRTHHAISGWRRRFLEGKISSRISILMPNIPNEVHLGVLKPEYIQRANSLGKTMAMHTKSAHRAESMARHPSAGSRRKELFDSARSDTERSFQAGH